MAFGINKIAYYFSLKRIYQIHKRNIVIKKNKDKHLRLGLGCSINNVEFGTYVYIGDNVTLVNTKIGNNSYINSNTEIRNTIIGKFCSIASNVKIVLGSHPTNMVSTHPAFYSTNKAFMTFADKTYVDEYKNVIIGNDVWISEGVVIPGGITIGDGAIIAAGAVVTKDVEPYSVVGGIPAKHIKYRFEEEEIKILLKFKWWDKDIEWLQKNYKSFHNIESFLELISNLT